VSKDDDKPDVEDEFPTEQNLDIRDALQAMGIPVSKTEKPTKAQIAKAIKQLRKNK
jgi:hypothetical protein